MRFLAACLMAFIAIGAVSSVQLDVATGAAHESVDVDSLYQETSFAELSTEAAKGFMPGASVYAGRACGSHVEGNWKIVLHSTEGSTASGAFAAYRSAGGVNPHFTITFEGGHFKAYQHASIYYGGCALRHPSGTCNTNNAHAVQIEIVGFATKSSQWPEAYLKGIASVLDWISATVGVKASAPTFLSYPSSYGNTKVRMSCSTWLPFNGICGHMHVPGNDHGDPGNMNIARVLSLMKNGHPKPVKLTAASFTGTATDQLNIRDSPFTTGAIVGTYSKGSSIKFIGYASGTTVSGNNKWYKSSKGFVSAAFVKGSPSASSTSTTPTTPVKPTPVKPSKPVAFTGTASDNVNCRSSPSTSATIKTVIKKGTKLTFSGYTTGTSVSGNNKWYKLNDGRGYVSATVIAGANPTSASKL